jgi:hypothetical protein
MARFFAVEKREKGRASPFHILPAVAGIAALVSEFTSDRDSGGNGGARYLRERGA